MTDAITVGFDFIDRRVMAAVERVASSDPNPADPFRGLYISDDRALELSRGESVSDAAGRRAHVAADRGRSAELHRAAARLGAGVRRAGRARRRGEVPALDRPDPRGVR